MLIPLDFKLYLKLEQSLIANCDGRHPCAGCAIANSKSLLDSRALRGKELPLGTGATTVAQTADLTYQIATALIGTSQNDFCRSINAANAQKLPILAAEIASPDLAHG